jgi:uncharacterized SAM-binding protein YcdF (DUF218 family)
MFKKYLEEIKSFFYSRYTLLTIVLLILLFVFHPFILKKMANHLIFETPIDQVEVIVVLTGDNGTRLKKGIDLYKQELAPQILISGGDMFLDKNVVDYMAEYAQDQGVPSENIILENAALSTFDNAQNTYELLKNLGYKKVILVTSKFHTKRTYKIFRKIYGDDIEISVTSAQDNIDYNNWWKNYEMAEKVLIEWGKTVIYWFK